LKARILLSSGAALTATATGFRRVAKDLAGMKLAWREARPYL
jgi:hypothetical protein